MTKVETDMTTKVGTDIMTNPHNITNPHNPICPHCGCPNDGDERDISWYWDYFSCKKCGRNFETRIFKVFQTRPIVPYKY